MIKRCLAVLTIALFPVMAQAQNADLPAVDRTLTISNANSAPANDNVNAADQEQRRQANIKKLREPAKLMPLLMIPLAAALYLLYERISRRR